MLFVGERWRKIVDLVRREGRASVRGIAHALGVSVATVRRDLAAMESRGLIQRVRGGAEPCPGVHTGLTISESRHRRPDEKERIGRAAARMIRGGDCVMMDGGFTTYQAARQIGASDPPVTVVTNSFDVIQAVATRSDVSLVGVGGEMLAASGSFVGPFAERQVRDLAADKAFLGANAICPTDGLAADHPLTAEIKRLMIERSREVIVVADHTKLGRSAFCRAAPIDAIDTIVTDDQADPGVLDAFREAGVAVIVAG